jgi:hypothetical protein
MHNVCVKRIASPGRTTPAARRSGNSGQPFGGTARPFTLRCIRAQCASGIPQWPAATGPHIDREVALSRGWKKSLPNLVAIYSQQINRWRGRKPSAAQTRALDRATQPRSVTLARVSPVRQLAYVFVPLSLLSPDGEITRCSACRPAADVDGFSRPFARARHQAARQMAVTPKRRGQNTKTPFPPVCLLKST